MSLAYQMAKSSSLPCTDVPVAIRLGRGPASWPPRGLGNSAIAHYFTFPTLITVSNPNVGKSLAKQRAPIIAAAIAQVAVFPLPWVFPSLLSLTPSLVLQEVNDRENCIAVNTDLGAVNSGGCCSTAAR